MHPHILLHSRLRTALPLCAQRDLRSRLLVRLKTTQTSHRLPRPSQRHAPESLNPKSPTLRASPPTSDPALSQPAKTTARRGPERILVYYGGTGRAVFLGMLRVATIVLFGTACLVIVPVCWESYPWYITPAVIVGGAIPMIFVAYTTAPYVNFIYLALPPIARRSREAASQYAKDLPPMAELILATTHFTTLPRKTAVRLGDLVPAKSPLRPVSFRNSEPGPRRFGSKPLTQFFTSERSHPGRETSVYYPELWPFVYRQIQNNSLRPKSKV